MPKTRPRPRPLVRVLALCFATLFALVVAEVALRFVPEPQPLGRLGYADASGAPVAGYAEGVRRGMIVPAPGTVPDQKPRDRFMFKPGISFYLTYTDNDVLQRDWLDEQGRVVNRINSKGIRDREQLAQPKPEGQRRIVCIGDSFTYGWGIPVEQGWVRLLEDQLRDGGADVRTVNCGAAGTVCIDEYVAALKLRFAAFEPDCVLLTICLNDLIPSSGLNLIDPPSPTGIRVLDLVRGAFGRGPLDLDPSRDWVQELLDLPRAEGEAGGLYNPDRPFEAMWSQGVPQKALREAKAWCDARKIRFGVIVWPFLQGLGEGRHYPFAKIHELLAADLAEAGIPLLDVLPALRGTDQEELWVSPADPHPNVLAQRLALPSIVAFTRATTGW